MQQVLLSAVLLSLSFTSLADKTVSTIAFGSCLRQWNPQPVWEAVVARKPDLFLFIGDNVYADTTDMAQMRSTYSKLAAQPGYQRLLAQCPVHATWDDHDYGANDAGADYPMRDQSEQIFLDFFQVPKTAPPRQRPGLRLTDIRKAQLSTSPPLRQRRIQRGLRPTADPVLGFMLDLHRRVKPVVRELHDPAGG